MIVSVRSLQARITAINTLERITRETQDPIEQRRAASALVRACTGGAALRAVNPPKGKDPGSSESTDQDSSGLEGSQDPSPSPLYSPSPDLDHVHTIKAAFAPFEEVDKDTALATLFEFLHKDAHVFRSPVPQDPEDFIEDVRHTPLCAPFSRVFFTPVCDITGKSKRHHASADAVEYKVTLEHGARRPIPLTVRLSLSYDGPFSRCWLITSITHAASWPSAP